MKIKKKKQLFLPKIDYQILEISTICQSRTQGKYPFIINLIVTIQIKKKIQKKKKQQKIINQKKKHQKISQILKKQQYEKQIKFYIHLYIKNMTIKTDKLIYPKQTYKFVILRHFAKAYPKSFTPLLLIYLLLFKYCRKNNQFVQRQIKINKILYIKQESKKVKNQKKQEEGEKKFII
ncbi:hypothetical protein TTHERM_000488289 (macronuclear) [Tetrahymena thermophila SB210]|uniref:Uncharacterized protein n=1 Tax=Tetrahymena thermophila (strain SB210) TaxID=312017 RepID=W7X4F1_TETTS|nr:hypothetical protein TTHERM_000488289 [Tetrahymena thermophila SB210]EWS74195.1 hypothetical protein TTHERM_000488289 [Tetrahymena thermophila SB210]|eukprot:XP_012653255.1 hypothetical protein TTHERM_000488289 [Tetrahymena thermophila SB210]